MDPPILSPITPRLAAPRGHLRTPSRSPTRTRITDDLLSDLSPATTLEAFTNPSGKLRASIEAATPVERAFGMRATLASKKIQEWVDELSAWPWPTESTSAGFEMPAAKRRRIFANANDIPAPLYQRGGREVEPEYMGSLTSHEVIAYETRIEEITEDMEDLNVEEIKMQVLDTHFSPRSRPSSSASNAPMPSLFASYTKMDDFTAVITATVLHSLPDLSKLMRLMDIWAVRLVVLRRIPPLLLALSDAEIALKSGWTALDVSEHRGTGETRHASEADGLSRQSFDVMRDVLQDKVKVLGQELDHMLDTLEGRQDTLPEQWLDRMEAIEQNYGDWVVAGDRKVREGEWARLAKARKEAADALKLKEQKDKEAARQEAEKKLKEDKAAKVSPLETSESAAEVADFKQPAQLQLEIFDKDPALGPTKEPEAINPASEPFSRSFESKVHTSQITPGFTASIVNEPAVQLPELPHPSRTANDAAQPDNMNEAVNAAGPSDILRVRAGFLVGPRHATDSSQTGTHNWDHSSLVHTSFAQNDGNLSEAKELDSMPDKTSKLSNYDDHDTANVQNVELPYISIQNAEMNSLWSDSCAFDNSGLLPATTAKDLDHAPYTETPDTEASLAMSHQDANIARVLSCTSTPSEGPNDDEILLPSAAGENTTQARSTHDVTTTSQVTPSTPIAQDTTLDDKTLSPSTHTSEEQVMNATFDSDPAKPEISPSQQSSPKEAPASSSPSSKASTEARTSPGNGHVSGYSTSDPTPLILEAEPVTYFSPLVSPVMASPSITKGPESPMTPKMSSLGMPAASVIANNLRISASPENSSRPSKPIMMLEDLEHAHLADSPAEHPVPDTYSLHIGRGASIPCIDGSSQSVPSEIELEDCSQQQQGRSVDFSGPNQLENQRLPIAPTVSTSSQASTTAASSGDDPLPSSPFPVSSPISESEALDSFSDIEEPSPTAGRIGQRNKISHDYSPPDSPTTTAMPRYRSVEPLASSNFAQTEPNDAPPTPMLDAPILENVEVSEAPIITSPTKSNTEQSTDDQIQLQISTILESIPARIHLTTEPNTESSSNDVLRPTKTRRPIIPSYRSHSSLSVYSRAPTPSFTLAPAYSKGTSRPRPQTGNPEIKLYHLSRSTGEAPIKLFVRLVGEHGERVMVRVGGGWADLGEYLREYASHHGRRSVSGEYDKVEVQNIPPRVVSSSSTASSATVRGGYGNGRSSPVSRPASALDQLRPMSSLAVRRTRESLTGENESSLSAPTRPRNLRSPSTPLPLPPYRKQSTNTTVETPPSASSVLSQSQSRSSSRLSWTEDDSSLGLAGPKGKKVVISERDQEWVESVKEKVRLASAEKEKEKEKEREREREKEGSGNGNGRGRGVGMKARHTSFGEMEKVGGTKRLFRKG